MIRFLTAGESHGKKLTTIVEGFPSNLPITAEYINYHLKRRQSGFGRSQRMKIESDTVEITSGIRFGKTLGAKELNIPAPFNLPRIRVTEKEEESKVEKKADKKKA